MGSIMSKLYEQQNEEDEYLQKYLSLRLITEKKKIKKANNNKNK